MGNLHSRIGRPNALKGGVDVGTLPQEIGWNSRAQRSLEGRPAAARVVIGARIGARESIEGARRLIALIAVITCTFGNLTAYGQTNIKRLLAYSTIAHAGYMMMAIPALMELAGVDPAGAEQAIAGLLIYLVVYVFMNMGAFAVVAFVRNMTGSEEISDYRGLIKSSPGIAICFTLMLFSLVGLPPLAGFIGKFAIFASLAEGFTTTGQGYLMVLLLFGGLNTALSLYYYLRVVKVMTLDDPPDPLPLPLPLGQSGGGRFILLLTIPTALLMLAWEPVSKCATSAALFLVQQVPL